MTKQTIKSQTGHRQLKVGHLVTEFASPGIGHILAASGCDFVFFDMEHSGFGIETIKAAVRFFEAADLPAMVRVPAHDAHFIAQAMDMGVEALIVPMVGTPEQVERIVRAMKYYPVGRRGVALQIAHDRYRPGAVADKFDAANRQTALIPLIETAEGVENIEAIAAHPEVDLIWIGHFDLSVSLGIPGEFSNPLFISSVERVAAAAKTAGKSLGRVVASAEQGVDLYKSGYDFICYHMDTILYHDALSDGIRKIRAGV